MCESNNDELWIAALAILAMLGTGAMVVTAVNWISTLLGLGGLS
jgi:hypothetical protein